MPGVTCFTCKPHLILTINIKGKYCYSSHFVDEDIIVEVRLARKWQDQDTDAVLSDSKPSVECAALPCPRVDSLSLPASPLLLLLESQGITDFMTASSHARS